MTDLYHLIDNDLTCSPTGDLQSVDGLTLGNQRVLRRLLTAPGSYFWQPDYGGGLQPAPVITLAPITNGVVVSITYVDAVSGGQAAVTFNVNP